MRSRENARIREALFQQYLQRATGILHLGAHLGHEAKLYSDYRKTVIWVEALPHIHVRLAQNIVNYPEQRAFCALLGDRNGVQKTFYISNNGEGVSSSIFEFGDYGNGGKSLWPDLNLNMVGSITLPMIRLDTLLRGNGIGDDEFDFWVLDLQGAELLALTGAGDLLQHCRALYVEVSTVEVYKGGILWEELQGWLDYAGFTPLWQPAKPHDDVLFVRGEEKRQVRNAFRSDNYVRHNQRRLEHLASLGLALCGKSVLEVGAGIGDHTTFFLDRGCDVVVTDARPENLAVVRDRFNNNPKVKVQELDMEDPVPLQQKFDIIHCYGLLYHVQRPKQALQYLAEHCNGVLLLETCVAYGGKSEINLEKENSSEYSQAFYGMGCRPARSWIWTSLKELFPYVYMPRTQPAHEEFPLDWTQPSANKGGVTRAIFIASCNALEQSVLLGRLPMVQELE